MVVVEKPEYAMRKLPEFSLVLGKIWFWDPAYVLNLGIEAGVTL